MLRATRKSYPRIFLSPHMAVAVSQALLPCKTCFVCEQNCSRKISVFGSLLQIPPHKRHNEGNQPQLVHAQHSKLETDVYQDPVLQLECLGKSLRQIGIKHVPQTKRVDTNLTHLVTCICVMKEPVSCSQWGNLLWESFLVNSLLSFPIALCFTINKVHVSHFCRRNWLSFLFKSTVACNGFLLPQHNQKN